MRLSHIWLLAPALVSALDSFQESLTLHPLPDGKLSVLFKFTTYFTLSQPSSSSISQSHHTLTPPSLFLPLQNLNISELTISFTSGRWDPHRSSLSGPLSYGSGGGGGEVRGWVRNGEGDEEQRWGEVTHALGGLFCAGLGPREDGENVKTFGDVYPPQRGEESDMEHFLLSHPHHNLCTENLTPFLSLLPSKGLSGLSALLAQPGVIFSWGFKSEGIEVVMPSDEEPEGQWTGWWEGVVDLIPPGAGTKHVKRDTSLQKLFGKRIPKACPEAESSVVRLVLPENEVVKTEPEGTSERVWIDGIEKEVIEWDLKESGMAGEDILVSWDEDKFRYPRTFTRPPISVSRTVVDAQASDGTFQIKLSNNANISREAVYSEIWPWWVKGWISEIEVYTEDRRQTDGLVQSIAHDPSSPPRVSTTTVHLSLTLPPQSTVVLRIPFTKLMLKYTDHRPDAERGQEIPSSVLTLLDLVGEDLTGTSGSISNVLKSGRARVYSPRLLLDIPTPDFSMPYNVIVMSSTVMAVFFGLMQGALTRRWGWVEVGSQEKHKEE
ncbi:hypothetical protein I350_04819 [Cryptococcus amylolentus CBS 6273]|uniref:Phosphatidylinositol glycan, class T n=1 Tax=Cryptococcus amylolentus CBS 6273 TaxID=1296118 RepID=A0A1E3JY14_9TREE|nr:hypothetical protein I350_04819 [Cryptococcus amylolentus CBS 6273]